MPLRFGQDKELRSVAAACLLCLSLLQLGTWGIIQAKAWLAPRLIERAWVRTVGAGGRPQRPWPWADTWPIARLRVPEMGVDRLVLDGDSGSVLAFGPGHARASAPPGSAGLAVIGGHRDTHFAFLEQLDRHDALLLQLPDGAWRQYRVVAVHIVDAGRTAIAPSQGAEQLILVTCYPFGALRPGGALRYVVEAVPATPGAAPNRRLLL
jgi:sortase A